MLFLGGHRPVVVWWLEVPTLFSLGEAEPGIFSLSRPPVTGSEIWGPGHSQVPIRGHVQNIKKFPVTSRSNVRRYSASQRTLPFRVPTVDSASV